MKKLPYIFILFLFGCSTTAPQKEAVYLYTGTYLDISKETRNARANVWKPDGSMICVTGRYTENVACYALSKPWYLETAIFHSQFDVSNETGSTEQISVPHGLFIHPDGYHMWVFNRTEIWQYRLQESWNVTTATPSGYAWLGDFVQRGHDIDFHPEGKRLFIDDRNAQAVHEVYLTTPWDISEFSWVYSLDISDEEEEVRGIEFMNEGRLMFLLDTKRKEVLIYSLENPYDLPTAALRYTVDLSGQSSDPRGISVREDLTYMYITGRDKQRIFQYQLRPGALLSE